TTSSRAAAARSHWWPVGRSSRWPCRSAFRPSDRLAWARLRYDRGSSRTKKQLRRRARSAPVVGYSSRVHRTPPPPSDARDRKRRRRAAHDLAAFLV
ncbi:hypothetical protein PENTCL1PPCAC_272, partial [Pristionchus entomophagus]